MENVTKTKEELGVELLELFYNYTGENTTEMRSSIQEILVQTMRDLTAYSELYDDRIDPEYLGMFSLLFYQLNKTCDIVEQYEKLQQVENIKHSNHNKN